MGFSQTLKDYGKKLIGKFVGQNAAIIVNGDTSKPIMAQFNPAEYRIIERTEYSEEERRKENAPSVQFKGKPLSTLNVKLYFDCDVIPSVASAVTGAINFLTGKDSGGISETINKLLALTIIDGEGHEPPSVEFIWGSTDFIGYAESVAATYTMFDNKGKPLRAVVDLTLRGNNGFVSEKKSPLMSPDRTKARVMTEDSNIWNIARKEYGDVREWRRIADANGIMNPLDIPVGEVLRVPSINDK